MSLSGEDFKGHYRKGPKTSIVRTSAGNIAPPRTYANLETLIASLPSYQTMRARYPKLIVRAGDEQHAKTAMNRRVPEEARNVQVDCWLYAVKSEPDNDFHTIIGSSPHVRQAKFLNVEVSGLPPAGRDRAILKQARQQLAGLAKSRIPTTKYEQVAPPKKVRVKGSLLFDGDHLPGKIGPGVEKPQTVWEIHPAISIQIL